MNLIELIGYTAATLTTVSFVPQVWKAVRDQDTRSLSLGMYVIFSTGVALWGLYGYLRNDWVIILANGVTIVLCLAILFVKIRNDILGARLIARGEERR